MNTEKSVRLAYQIRRHGLDMTNRGGTSHIGSIFSMADVIAVLFYLSGVVPFVGITLVELGLVGSDAASSLKWHATFIAIFLVVAHVAMIFGMLEPSLLGYQMIHQH